MEIWYTIYSHVVYLVGIMKAGFEQIQSVWAFYISGSRYQSRFVVTLLLYERGHYSLPAESILDCMGSDP